MLMANTPYPAQQRQEFAKQWPDQGSITIRCVCNTKGTATAGCILHDVLMLWECAATHKGKQAALERQTRHGMHCMFQHLPCAVS